MIKMSRFLAVVLVTMLAISGCSSNSSDSSSGGSTLPGGGGTTPGGGGSTSSYLDGTWTTGEGFRTTFTGSNYNGTGDMSDNGVVIHFNETGHWVDRGTKRVQPNDRLVHKIEGTTDTCVATMTLSDADQVTAFNEMNYCGGNWTVNVAKDVSDCAQMGMCDNSTDKDIAYIESDRLYFGDDTQGVDAEGYPEALDLEYYLTRQ